MKKKGNLTIDWFKCGLFFLWTKLTHLQRWPC